ncbi:MAG: DedA family protein [Actinomycetales bacterium]
MSAWLDGLPFGVAIATLFVIVLARAQATYWLGRLARSGAHRTRVAAMLEGPRGRRASELLDRYGLPAITLSFLTVGLQTAINAGAGVLGIRWPRYTLAMLPGCLAWATIYATIGFAAFEAWLKLAATSMWAAWLGLALVLLLAVVLWRRHRARRREEAMRSRPGRSSTLQQSSDPDSGAGRPDDRLPSGGAGPDGPVGPAG